MEKPKVLLITDDLYDFEFLKSEVGERAEIVWAQNLPRGHKLFGENSDIELVAMSPAMFKTLSDKKS